MTSSETLQSSTGAALNLYRWQAPGKPHAIVQINHGLAEHAARYARFGQFLAARGFNAYAHDHRGHGLTKAPDAPLGSFGPRGGGAVVADVLAVRDRIEADHPGVPVILFGHSMGGLVTLNTLVRHSSRFAATAIWNANFTGGPTGLAAQSILAWERFRLGSDVPSRLLPRLTFGTWAKKVRGGRTRFDWLSRDTAEVDAYIADPLCGWEASVGMWQTVFGFAAAGTQDDSFARIRRDMPVNLVGGAEDPATDGGKAVTRLADRMRRLGFSNLVSTVYPQTRHESLNELNRNLIMEHFADWAARAVPQPTQAAT